MQTIIKLESREEMTLQGTFRTIYRRREFRPGHPDYEKELALQKEFVKTQGYLPKVKS